MKAFFTVIVLTTLVAQLPQLQAAPGLRSGLNSEILDVLRGLFQIEKDMQAETQGGQRGFYATSCKNDITSTGILKDLSDQYGSSFRVEFRCGHPTSSCTRLTDYEGVSYHRYLELCDQGGSVCRAGLTARIRVGTCNDWELIGPKKLEIPVGTGSTTVGAEVFYSASGNSMKCIAVENFGGPACPGY